MIPMTPPQPQVTTSSTKPPMIPLTLMGASASCLEYSYPRTRSEPISVDGWVSGVVLPSNRSDLAWIRHDVLPNIAVDSWSLR